ncbi:MAG: sensor domain-containing diguanylate cyclase, partial [Proteobacteria bacterium]
HMFGPPGLAYDAIDRKLMATRGYYEEDGITPLAYEKMPITRVFAGEAIVRTSVVHRPTADAAPRYLRVNATALRRPDGSTGAAIGVVHDVTEERTLQRSHEEREVLLDVVLANLPETGVLVFDRSLRFLLASGDEVLKSIGLSTGAVGKLVSEVVSPKRLPVVEAAFRATLAGQNVSDHFAHGGRALDARTIPLQNKDGSVFAGIGLLNDVTVRKEAERLLQDQARELEALSLSDELTGLHNRRGFMTLAGQQLKIATRTQRHAAVMYLDVNDLKPVNDGLGHEEGDRLLRDVAAVLRGSFRDSDVIARLGGDEFALLTVDIAPQSLDLIEQRVVHAVDAFNARAERAYRMSVSLGTELFDPSSQDTLESLLARADERMYARKQALKRSRLA